jgi:hypothetical protein
MAYSIGTNQPLPAGVWSCTFALGSMHVTVPFSTDGPKGDVVDLAICAGEDTIRGYGGAGFLAGTCRKDESVSGLPKTRVIVCSVIVTHRVGSFPEIEILDGSGRVIESDARTGARYTTRSYGGSTITESLWDVWAWVRSDSPFFFAPGPYACRVSLDDRVVMTKSFTIGG